MSGLARIADVVSMKMLHRTLTAARSLAERTPDDRNRAVDFFRAISILAVVFGHWLMAAPEVVNGEVRMVGLIGQTAWAQWLTWILQVMPVFFFVGGYANAVGWRAARRDHTPYPAWLRERLRRLILPAIPVLAFWAPVAAIAWRSGVDPDLITIASQAALVPTWFLATYVLIVALTPLTVALWERAGWVAVIGTTAIAGMVDVLSLGLDVHAAAWVNYVFVWNAVHMLGYAWADDRIGTVRARLAMAAGGVSGLAALVTFGPYPVAMVGLDNAAVTNSNPPRVTLIALGLFQFGLAMATEHPIRRWLKRTGPWTAVVAINGSIMSLYLWHLTVMVAVLAGGLALGGFGFGLEVDSAAWWMTRPLWLAVLLALTLPVVAVVARFERPGRDQRPAPAGWQPVVAVIGVCAGLAMLARHGIADENGLNVVATILPVAGLAVGGVMRVPGLPRRVSLR
jgi:surface polysaccharide O-acyltransferase-like enzyme